MRKIKLLALAALALLGGGNTAKAQAITDISQLSNNKVYTLTTPTRGAWASTVNGNKMTSTGETSDIPAANQQFALLNIEDGYYIYSVAAKKFVRPTNVLLADKGTQVEFLDQNDGTFVIKAVGQNLYANLGGSKQFTFDSWGTPDDGNKLTIAEAGDFDPTEAIAIWTYGFGKKVFTITSERGNWTANDAGTALTSTTTREPNSTDANKQWTILRFDDKYYIYNVGAKKYLKKDGSLFAGKGDPINLKVQSDDNYPFMLYTEDNNYFNMQETGGFSINNYATPDPGNQQAFNVIEGEDVYDEAYELFTAVPVTVNYKIYYNNELAETIENVAATATKPAALPTANINGLYSYTYEPATIAETTTDVNVTATWNGPFNFSAGYDNAQWYNLKIRGTKYVGKTDDEPYSNIENVSEATRASDAYQWAIVDAGYGKVQVLNKAAGNGYTLKNDNNNAVMREGESSWDILDNGAGFVLRETDTDNNYINDSGSKLKFWEYGRTDAGSTFTVEAVPEIPVVNVTYSVKYNNVEVATATIPAQQGVAIPEVPSELNRDYVTFSYDDTQLASEGLIVDVTAEWNGPVTLYASLGDVTKWQNLAVRKNYYVTSSSQDADGALKPIEANALGLVEDAYQWAFVGDPYHIQLFNKAEANNFGYDGDDIPSFQETGTYWTLKQSTSSIANSYMLIVPGTNNQLNQSGGATGSLKFWNYGGTEDAGSAFTIFDVPTNFAEFITDDVKQYYTSDATGYFTLNPETKALWNDSYNTSCTFNEYQALINGISTENFVLPGTGYYRLKNNYYNSYMGLKATTVYGNYTADADVNGASTIVKLTNNGSNEYSIAIQGKYLQALTQSANVPTAAEEVFFKPGIQTLGCVSFSVSGEGYTYTHCNPEGEVVGWELNAEASQWIVKDATDIKVTVTSAGYATLNVPFAVNVPEGVTAYTGKISDDKTSLKMTPVNGTIPANTPVVLEAEAATYSFAIADDEGTSIDNDLTGTLTELTKPDGALTLQLLDDKVGFYTFTGSTIGANKAYLLLPADGSVKGLTLQFGGSETGIESVKNAAQNGIIYNLAGQRVAKAQKGIFIENGKKVVVK